MATDEQRRNPFMAGLEKAAMVPVNAVKLPFQILQSAIDPRAAARADAPAASQRALHEQVMGQPAPFSEGRDWANRLSLGLIPGNPSAAVDPNQLNSQQQGRFSELSALQQALLQAKRPQDFAELLNNETLFAQPPAREVVGANDRLVDSRTGEVLIDAAAPQPKVLPPGAQLVDAEGQSLGRNEYEPPSLVEQRGAAAGASSAAAEASRAKAEEARAKAEKLRAETPAPGAPPPGPTLEDRNKLSTMTNRITSRVTARVKDLDRAFTAARNAFRLFELRDAASAPPEYRRELEKMGFKDLDNRSPRAMQDLMLLQQAVRITDPPGRISDSEQKMYAAARQIFDPGIVEAAFNRTPFTDQQRNEVMFAIGRQLQGALNTNDLAVVDGRKEALRDMIAGQGRGVDPNNIPDVGRDLRLMAYGQDLGDQANYPVADAETEALLEQLWYIKNPGVDPTADLAALVKFANDHGFRVNEFSQ